MNNNSTITLETSNTSNIKIWSETFEQYVDSIDGIDIPGERILIETEDKKLIDITLAWIKKIE